jgi:uncharacterized NAD(P)/FAD-binding protein YdhS
MTAPSIAIVGAGFSGTLLALHLLRRCTPATRITLIERTALFGRGQAYASGNPSHVLNVPAGRMSAFHDKPNDFLDWLQMQASDTLAGVVPAASSFVPRGLYGTYVRQLLNREMRGDVGQQLELVSGEVLMIDRTPHPLILHLDRKRRIAADLVVLAVGNFPPEPPAISERSFYDTGFYRADPWAVNALRDLEPDSPVLLIGSGLTMVDTVISLLDQGHTGRIHAISRRGLLPRRHAAALGAVAEALPYPTDVVALTRFLRQQAKEAAENGGDWRPVIDGLRPFTVDIWQAMRLEDRRRFLRHLRPWWDVYRHRMAGQVADRIDAARNSGQLQIRAGRIRSYNIAHGQAEAIVRPRGGEDLIGIPVARVINCAGPNADYDRIEHPLIRYLLADGTVRPDALRLGLDVTGTGALVNRTGAISRRLFAVGPVTKGTFWEMTAVPDIRRQTELMAQHISGLVKAPEGVLAAATKARSALSFAI